MKRAYVKMVMTPSGVELRNHVMAGSVTAKAIKVNEVTVEDYHTGFGASTPDPSDDFQEINFD